jgi:hypothetical protein
MTPFTLLLGGLKKYAILIVAIGAFISGAYATHVWNGYQESKAVKQVQELKDEFTKHEGKVAATLEEKLKELKANERIIEREKLKIIDRPIYLNECIDTDGLDLINKQRTKEKKDK